jgi:hypothetical protein
MGGYLHDSFWHELYRISSVVIPRRNLDVISPGTIRVLDSLECRENRNNPESAAKRSRTPRRVYENPTETVGRSYMGMSLMFCVPETDLGYEGVAERSYQSNTFIISEYIRS